MKTIETARPVLAAGAEDLTYRQVPGGRVRVWALDHRGARTGDVRVSQSGGDPQFTIGPDHRAVWYEVEVAR